MSFTSGVFYTFLVLFFGIYFLVPKKFQWVVMLIGSYFFYIYASLGATVFLLLTTISTFFTGILIGKENQRYSEFINKLENILTKEQQKEFKAKHRQNKKLILTGALILIFGILAFLKYYNFFALSADFFFAHLSINTTLPQLDLLLPLGISFYTFQSAGYVIDVNRGKIQPDRNIAKFALFVSFFPQIVQGPIGRYDELAFQLYQPHQFDYTRVKYGFQLILWGLFKKMVIADRAAFIVNTVFDRYTEYQGFTIFFGVLLYCVQIYGDFSGGIDIARGVAQIMGISLRLNFKRPFFATSIEDFWRRWHISLSEWMRDYIFYPLSLSRSFTKLGRSSRKIFGSYIGKLLPILLAQLITFLIVGIWHGANWKFVVYGLYNGFFIFAGILFGPLSKQLSSRYKLQATGFCLRLFSILITIFLVCIGRYFSRAPDLITALRMLKRTFTVFNPQVFLDGTVLNLGLDRMDLYLLFLSIGILFAIDLLQEKGYHLREKISKQKLVFRWAIYLVAIFSILIFGIYGLGFDSNSFIYMGF